MHRQCVRRDFLVFNLQATFLFGFLVNFESGFRHEIFIIIYNVYNVLLHQFPLSNKSSIL